MWDYVFGVCASLLISGLTYYWYTHRYNDDIIELLTLTYNDIKCIKYYYRGKKYIFLTENLDDDIKRLEREIDIKNPEKDKKPETDYKYIKAKIFIKNKCKCDEKCVFNKEIENYEEKLEEVLFEEPNLLYSFIGPANSYYFAFDVEYYKKLTKFMNFLFETEEGTLIYGRFSALLSPQRYFEIKNKLIKYKTDFNVKKIEWELE
jgi:hypothetical protein